MADKILHKRSGTPSAVPPAASMELGELALNTADGRAFMKKSNGAVVEIGANGSAFFSLVTVTATSAGQTSFTIPGGYTPGAVVVFLNGSSLAPAHYTATSGTAVALASGTGVVVGSELVVLRLTAFQVADALPLLGTAADSSKLGGQLPSYYATQADLAGVTPGPEFYKRSNILGTVSQSGGVPTGAIIERGSNANGEYVRFAGGLQIAWLYRDTTQAPTVAAGNLFRTDGEILYTPIDFAGIANSATGSTGDSNSWFSVEASSLNTYYVRRYSAYSNAVAKPYRLTVIGRWH